MVADYLPVDEQHRTVGLFGMVVMGFFWVCGGMYGNEELLGTAPPLLVLSALVIVPLCHSLPVSMMIAECGTAWPADGGLPVFVQRAFGDTIGGYNTIFTWLNCLVDAAIYPVMAASYTKELFSQTDERLVCVAIVTLMTAMQLGGLDCIVRFSALLLLLSLTPTVVFTLFGAGYVSSATLLVSEGPRHPTLLLSFVFWLDSGFYSLADIAGEVKNPGRVMPLACLILQPMNMLINLLPLTVALSLDSNAAHYTSGTGYFSTLATRVGGRWLGKAFFCASMVSNLGNYSSQVVSAEKLSAFFIESQLGAVAGADAPSWKQARLPCAGLYGRISPLRLGAYLCSRSEASGQQPCVIVFNACCILALILCFQLEALIELVAFIMTINMTLFLLAFVQLRRAEPHTPRPFRLPGGQASLCFAVLSPLCFIFANLYILLAERDQGAARLAFLLAVVGVGALLQRLYRRLAPADTTTPVSYHVPGPAAKAASASLLRFLALGFALSCLLVGSSTLGRPGLPPARPPPPPPPPPSPPPCKALGVAKHARPKSPKVKHAVAPNLKASSMGVRRATAHEGVGAWVARRKLPA